MQVKEATFFSQPEKELFQLEADLRVRRYEMEEGEISSKEDEEDQRRRRIFVVRVLSDKKSDSSSWLEDVEVWSHLKTHSWKTSSGDLRNNVRQSIIVCSPQTSPKSLYKC